MRNPTVRIDGMCGSHVRDSLARFSETDQRLLRPSEIGQRIDHGDGTIHKMVTEVNGLVSMAWS